MIKMLKKQLNKEQHLKRFKLQKKDNYVNKVIVYYLLLFINFNCFSQAKYFKIANHLESIKAEMNYSFSKRIEKEKIDLFKIGVSDNNYFNQLSYYNEIFLKKDSLSKLSIYYYNMDNTFNQILNECKDLEIENMYIVSFQCDKGDFPNIYNFVIVDNFDLIKFYGLKTIREESFYFENSFSFNFEQFFLNLSYSYFNIETTSIGGVHDLYIAKVSAIGNNNYKIETRIAFNLLPYQEIYLKYLLGIKKDFSFYKD